MHNAATPDYLGLVIDALNKIEQLQKEREVLDIETAKLEQFVFATSNFLSDEHRHLVTERMRLFQDLTRVRDAGLTDAIRAVLTAEGDWFTTTQVRDRLVSLQYDFSSYTTNPLASVSTTLKRMKPEDVEIGTRDGVTAYRWKNVNRIKFSPEMLKAAMQAARKTVPSPPTLDIVPGALKGKK